MLWLIGAITVLLTWAAVAAARPGVSGHVKLAHGPVQYELSPGAEHGGSPRRLVVLVPGFAVPMVVWDATVPALVQAGFSVLRFDLYGRGRSARPAVAYRPELFAEQIRELVTVLGLPPRFDMVASSMGGAVAAVFATRYSDAVDRLVLVGPVGLVHDFPLFVTFLRAPVVGRWYFTARFHDVMLAHLQDNVRAHAYSYPAVFAEFRRQLEVPGTAEALLSTFQHTLLADVREDFRQLGLRHRPTLAIWGAEDRLVPVASGVEALGRVIPHARVETIARASHLPQLERPDVFNALVKAFLGRP